MNVLRDECVPKTLKAHLIANGHECSTVQESRWAGKPNGELLDLAEPAFAALITVDTNIRYQQNLAGRKIAIVILQSPSNRLDHLRQFSPACLLALSRTKPGEIVVIGGQS